MKRKIVIIGGLILLLACPTFAAMTIKGHVYRADGATGVGASQPVQVIDASGTVRTGPGGAVIGGTVAGESTVTDSSSWIKDISGLFIGRSGSNIRLRAWDGGIADGNFYGYAYAAGNIYLGATTDAPRTETIDIICDLKAAPPAQPRAPATAVSYDGDFNPQATVTYNTYDPVTGYNSEICEVPAGANNAYVYTFYENPGGGGRNWQYITNSTSITITSTTPTVPSWLLSVGEHSVTTQARNYFDLSTASPPASFTIRSAVIAGQVTDLGIQLISYSTASNDATVRLTWKASGGATRFRIWASSRGLLQTDFAQLSGLGPDFGPAPDFNSGDIAVTDPTMYFQVLPEGVAPAYASRQVVGKFTWRLRKPSTGINSIAFLFTKNWSQPATGGDVPDIELLRAEHVRATMPGFEFIGRWNAATQLDEGYLASGAGTNFNLTAGEGFQVSVNAENTYWTIVGVK